VDDNDDGDVHSHKCTKYNIVIVQMENENLFFIYKVIYNGKKYYMF